MGHPLIKQNSQIEDFILGTGWRYAIEGTTFIAPRQGWFKSVEGGWDVMWSYDLPKALKKYYIESLEREIEWTKTGKTKLRFMDVIYKDILEGIKKLGFQEVEDRGMAENGGFLFKKADQELRYWKIHPRINISKDGIIAFDTGIVTEEDLIDLLKWANAIIIL